MEKAERNPVTIDQLMRSINSLNKKDRGKLIAKLLDIDEFREDLVDTAILESRKDDKLRPFRDYLRDRGIKP